MVFGGTGVVLAGLLALALWAPWGTAPAAARLPQVSLARLGGGPDIQLPLSDGGAGHPLVLVWFASWCAPCQAELPQVARVAAAAEASGTPVRFVGIDGNDAPSAGVAFVRASGVTFPVASDPDQRLANLLGLAWMPMTVFVDRHDAIVQVVRGPITPRALEAAVHRLANRP